MILLLPSQSTVLNAYAVLIGATPGNVALKEHQAFIAANGEVGYTAALNNAFKAYTTATMATALLANTGLGSVFTQADAVAYLNANASNRVGAMISLANELYNYGGTNATLLTAKTAYMDSIEASYNYSADQFAGIVGKPLTGVSAFALTVLQDALVGGALNDTFLARTINNVNTLQDGDSINGGAGDDTLIADLVAQTNAITPLLTNIETVVIRAQTVTADATNGNNQNANTVQIDAQRSLAVDSMNTVTAGTGVTRWESNNSRSDVIIEDVRIGNLQKTSDVTIAFVESDPGHVDFGVYFDQHSLRNASTGSSTLTIQLMDTGAAAATTTPATPLLNQPYDQFKFAVNGVLTSINLNPTGNTTVAANADTYAQLLAAFQTALTGSGATAALGANFTVTDPISGKPVTGQSIVLTGGAGTVITTPAGSGWFNTTGAAVPATANIYNTFTTGATSQTELVTSKVILDDVGRGSTGGDLVIGGMSLGQTSTSRGVERFEIEVRDNSKLQTINSTNNALREVTIKSGVTSKTVANAYTTTVLNEGDLNVDGGSVFNPVVTNVDANLAGVNNYSRVGNLGGQAVVSHSGVNAAGFTDVRLIDASDFKGKFSFTANISSDSIPKYVTAVDTSVNPAADVATVGGNANFNVLGANFIYTGGNDNDTMVVTIDGAATASRSTIVSGQSDMTFSVNGGEGDDAITVRVIDPTLAGGAQAWYNNQKLNANIAINGGDGNDTIRTPGAGDKIIDAGAGNDTVYTDNTGALVRQANATGFAGTSSVAYTTAAAAELAAALTAAVAANATDATGTAPAAAGFGAGAAAVVAALNALDALTANASAGNLTAAVVVPAVPTHAAVIAATQAAYAAGAISTAQKVAIDTAYNAYTTAPTITAPVTLNALSTFVGGATNGAATLAAEVTSGDSVVAGILASANTARAAALGADVNTVVQNALLDATQLAVVNATKAMNDVDDRATVANEAGTTTILNGLTAVQSALSLGAGDVAVVAALNAAIASGAISAATATALFTAAVATPGTLDAAEVTAVTLALSPLLNNATNANTAALAVLTTATRANTAFQNAIGVNVAGNTVGATVGADNYGTAGTTAANTAARAAATIDANLQAGAQLKEVGLIALKGAITTTTPSYVAVNLLTNAQNAGLITAAENVALTATVGASNVVTPVSAAQKLAFDTGVTGFLAAGSMDSLISAARASVEFQTVVAANSAATAFATDTAAKIQFAAAVSGSNSLTAAAPTAVYVFNTSNQTSSYDRLALDDRNLNDLKSDANNTYNFFNSTLKVTYKGINASALLAGTAYKTTDLQINQAIKLAINSDPVLSKLLLATDGPANSLVVTSLIDGTHTTGNLAVSVTMPVSGGLSVGDIAGAAAAYGLPASTTEAALLSTIIASKVAFDAKGDYVTHFAESGAAGGNVVLTGANSTSSSDNTVTPGAGNDVVVLGTTVGTDLMTSSNEKIVYTGASFGNDTIVNFSASGLGFDTLDFTALNGSGAAAFNSFSADKSIVVGAPTAVGATVLTAVQVAALFTDSATAINHVYVAVDATNIGTIWQVADAAGTAAGNVTATVAGTISLSDTAWSTLSALNFSGYTGALPVATATPGTVTTPVIPTGVPVVPVVPVVPGGPTLATVAVGAAGSVIDSAAVNTTYNVALATYLYSIAGFGAGDKIVSPVGVVGTLNNNSFTDGAATVQYASGGFVTQVTLTGLTTAQDGALFGTADLNTVFGAGTFA